MSVRTVDVSAIINNRRLTGFNYGLIVLSWLITVFDGFDMMMVSFTAPYMRDEFGLSKTMLGYVFSAGLFGMMLGGFFFSYIADRFGRRSGACFLSLHPLQGKIPPIPVTIRQPKKVSPGRVPYSFGYCANEWCWRTESRQSVPWRRISHR